MGSSRCEAPENKSEGFEKIFKIVGGHGRFQWFILAVVSLEVLVKT
jgi:hypothetical protein